MAWLKVIHLFGVIAWFAGLFYLPRLFVYHADAEDDVSRHRFAVMEQRLLNIIMLPAALIACVFGLAIALANPAAYFSQTWFLAKLLLVAILAGFHFWCWRVARTFAGSAAAHSATHSSRTFRIMNELPTAILLFVLILAIVRPF